MNTAEIVFIVLAIIVAFFGIIYLTIHLLNKKNFKTKKSERIYFMDKISYCNNSQENYIEFWDQQENHRSIPYEEIIDVDLLAHGREPESSTAGVLIGSKLSKINHFSVSHYIELQSFNHSIKKLQIILYLKRDFAPYYILDLFETPIEVESGDYILAVAFTERLIQQLNTIILKDK